jgi:CheY-like chemotaxis protein
VDLRRWNPQDGPDVYIVPAKDLKKEYDGVQIRKYAQFHHHRPMAAMERYRNNWQPITDALQREEPAPRAARPTASPTPRRRLSGRPVTHTVLVVDDMGSAREMLRDVLTERGYEVLLAESGATALEIAASHAVDACLVDLEMPGMNGIEFSEALRQQNGPLGRHPQVWIMTGSYRTDILQPALAAGVSAVLRKPLDMDEVCRYLDGTAHPLHRALQGQARPVDV